MLFIHVNRRTWNRFGNVVYLFLIETKHNRIKFCFNNDTTAVSALICYCNQKLVRHCYRCHWYSLSNNSFDSDVSKWSKFRAQFYQPSSSAIVNNINRQSWFGFAIKTIYRFLSNERTYQMMMMMIKYIWSHILFKQVKTHSHDMMHAPVHKMFSLYVHFIWDFRRLLLHNCALLYAICGHKCY